MSITDLTNGLLTGQNSDEKDAEANGEDTGDDDDAKFVGMIVGSVSGGLLCLIILTVVTICCLCRSANVSLSSLGSQSLSQFGPSYIGHKPL